MNTAAAVRHAEQALRAVDRADVHAVLEAATQALNALRELLAALSTPPDEDVRALADHLNGLMDSLDESVSHEQVYEQLRVAWEMARVLCPRGTVTDAEHREAVHRAVRAGIESVIRGDADRDLVRAVADHVLDLEARSCGTVTDAEVDRVALMLWADYDAEHAGSTVDQFFGQARRLLEAAMEARS